MKLRMTWIVYDPILEQDIVKLVVREEQLNTPLRGTSAGYLIRSLSPENLLI
jgi:hypothetical protein